MGAFLRVALVPYEGAFLMCAACGRSGAELGLDTAYYDTPIVGVHRKCRGLLHTPVQRKRPSHRLTNAQQTAVRAGLARAILSPREACGALYGPYDRACGKDEGHEGAHGPKLRGQP